MTSSRFNHWYMDVLYRAGPGEYQNQCLEYFKNHLDRVESTDWPTVYEFHQLIQSLIIAGELTGLGDPRVVARWTNVYQRWVTTSFKGIVADAINGAGAKKRLRGENPPKGQKKAWIQPADKGTTTCPFLSKPGGCKKGASCDFRHS